MPRFQFCHHDPKHSLSTPFIFASHNLVWTPQGMAWPRGSQQGTAPPGHSGSTPTSPLPHLDRRHRPLLPLTPTPPLPPPSRAAVRLSTSAQRGWRGRRLHGGGVSSSDGGAAATAATTTTTDGGGGGGGGGAPAAAFIDPPPARLRPVARGRWRQEWRKARGPRRAASHATDIAPRGGGWLVPPLLQSTLPL